MTASTVIFELYIVVPYTENFYNFFIKKNLRRVRKLKKYYALTLFPPLFFHEIFGIVLIFRLRRIGLKKKSRKYRLFEKSYGPKKVFT